MTDPIPSLSLDALLASRRDQEAESRFEADAGWLQGRSLFGGLQAAFLLAAMRRQLPQPAPLRSLQVSFIGPVPAGEVRIRAQLLRAGRTAAQVEGRLLDASGATLCAAIALFGPARESVVRIPPPAVPIDWPPATRPVPRVPGMTPEFLRHFHMHWLEGHPPYSGGGGTRVSLGLGFADPVAAIGEEHLLALADVIPPLGLSHLRSPTNGSSVGWMLELLEPVAADTPAQGWQFRAELQSAGHGYLSQSGVLLRPDGVPAALSRQTMVIFA
ncbi:MAG TPA: thioesterase family protein [Nevskiaceae bacterium]|nr:thioesterase family protein [Nevskiaceae bacterium]